MKNKDIKKEMILEAAFQLFIERGYQNTRITDIASAVNMGKSTFYDYFDSKEAIFAELIQSKISQGYLEDWRSIASSDLPAREKLAKMLSCDLAFMEGTGNFLNLLYEVMISGEVCNKLLSPHDFQHIFLSRYECLRQVVHEGIKIGQFVDMDADLISVAVMGSFHFFLPAKFHFFPGISSDLDSHDLLKVLLTGISFY